ncbi:hypothetical protein [Salinicoccus roseus]
MYIGVYSAVHYYIGRNPGVVTVTFLAPRDYLSKAGILDQVEEIYR